MAASRRVSAGTVGCMEHFAETSPGPKLEPGERLRDYDRVKLELASVLQSALRLIGEQTDPTGHQKCRDLLARLAEDRFALAVMGRFNRGKSSLMNALLGMDRLPVGIVPLTSVITKVSYGNPERVLIGYSGSGLKREIPLARLSEYVTEEGNPGNSKQIAAAEVQLPAEFLRLGLTFIDTPGVGSAITANTATTERFLPDADAVILVTSFESPMDREEIEFLKKVRENVRKIFFVVNKMDLMPLDQRSQVLAFIRTILDREVGIHEPRLFPLSALAGLASKLKGSAEKLVESGLPPFEERLVEFLTRERTEEFLLRTCNRAQSLIGDLGLRTPPRTGVAAFASLADRLALICEELQESSPGEKRTSPPAQPFSASRPEAEVMEATLRRCEACSVVADAMLKFMASYQYHIIVNEDERASLASCGGLCPFHTWQYSEMASPQGISSSYPDVLKALSRRLRLAAENNPAGELSAATRTFVPGQEECRACQEHHAVEQKVLSDILERITVENNQSLGKLPVLCLPHLSMLLGQVADARLARSLVGFEAAIFERLAENMQRYALKHDALRRGLQSDDERVAYHRALSQLVGDRRLRAPWRIERLV